MGNKIEIVKDEEKRLFIEYDEEKEPTPFYYEHIEMDPFPETGHPSAYWLSAQEILRYINQDLLEEYDNSWMMPIIRKMALGTKVSYEKIIKAKEDYLSSRD